MTYNLKNEYLSFLIIYTYFDQFKQFSLTSKTVYGLSNLAGLKRFFNTKNSSNYFFQQLTFIVHSKNIYTTYNFLL